MLKGGRIFDLVTRRTHRRATSRSATTASSGRWANIAARARSTSAARSIVPGFIDTHLPCRILADHAAGIRPLRARARRHHRDLRSARDRQRARASRASDISSTPRWRPRWICACSSRAACRRRISRLRARGSRSDDLAAVRRSSQSARPRRIHELSRACSRAIPACLAKLAAFQDRPHRRPQPAAARARPQRLSRAPASAPITR